MFIVSNLVYNRGKLIYRYNSTFLTAALNNFLIFNNSIIYIYIFFFFKKLMRLKGIKFHDELVFKLIVRLRNLLSILHIFSQRKVRSPFDDVFTFSGTRISCIRSVVLSSNAKYTGSTFNFGLGRTSVVVYRTI